MDNEKSILEIYNDLLSKERHYPTSYSDISTIIKESSYLLYDFKDSTEELEYNSNTHETYVKEKSPLFYYKVIDSEDNQEFLDIITEEAPFYYITPSIYTDIDKMKVLETRDPGINNVPSALQESDFYETWFRDAFGYLHNLLILDSFNKLRYPYINENQYLYSQVFSRLAKTAFDESEDSESRIDFNDTEEDNNKVYDSTYKYFGEEIGSTDYINDIIEKKIISNYVFIDFSSEQSNFLTNTVNSLYESGQISYSDMVSEKLIFKLQEIKNELLRRKLSGTYTLYKLALSSLNRNGSFVGVLSADDANVETNTSLTTATSHNGKRPVRLINTPGLLTETVSDYDYTINPIKAFYENVPEGEKVPLKTLVPIYYTSSDVQDVSSIEAATRYNNEMFYTLGYTSYEDSKKYIKKTNLYGTDTNKYETYLFRDNSNTINLDSLDGILSASNIQKYENTLDRLTLNEDDELVYRTLDSLTEGEDGELIPYALDQQYSVISLEDVYSNVLDINADHIMYHVNSVQQALGEYYDYLTYPIASGNSVCLMDTFWLNYIQYQLSRKTKVNDTTLIGTQVNTFIDLKGNERQAIYEFFGVSYLGDGSEGELSVWTRESDPKYMLLWYCVINYDTIGMKINSFDKTLISKITLKSKAPANFYEDRQNNIFKSEYEECEPFTKYNIGVIPFTYSSLKDEKVRSIKLGFYDNDYYDDAELQGYGKAYFVFSKYDLTNYCPDKDIDPAELDEHPDRYSGIFTNSYCDGIKTLYYVVKKTEIEEFASVTNSGYFKNDGSIVHSYINDAYRWSDPIRVIDLPRFIETIDGLDFKATNNPDVVHFSPDWEGLSYYLNPYLNFTDKSASPLRHKKAFKSYDTTALEVPQSDFTVKGTVDTFLDLLDISGPINGDVYFVTAQSEYYSYDFYTNSWAKFERRDTVEGPSNHTALSNLARMRRLDFAANDLGEAAPTYWVDERYSPEFETDGNHPAHSVFGLYLDKCQPESINKSSNYDLWSNIKGDNRNRDIFDFEYSNIIYLNEKEKYSDIDIPEENILYIKKINSVDSEKKVYIKDNDFNDFVSVVDDDFGRSSIYYSDSTYIPCLAIEDGYSFIANSNSNVSNKYFNYLKLTPCSDESLSREIIETGLSLQALKQENISDEDKRRYLFKTSNGNVYLYNFNTSKYVNVDPANYGINTDLEERAKENWYWNSDSEDGITVCFDLEIKNEGFYKEVTDQFRKGIIYFYKDNNGRYVRKRPTDYPAEIGRDSGLYIEDFREKEDSDPSDVTTYKMVKYGSTYGNYYYAEDENGSFVRAGTYRAVDPSDVYNPNVKYFTYDENNTPEYTQKVIDDYYFGTLVGFVDKDLYFIDGDTVEKVGINEQFSTEAPFYEKTYSAVSSSEELCFEDTNDIKAYFIKQASSSEIVYIQCTELDTPDSEQTYYVYKYNADNQRYEYEAIESSTLGSNFEAFYVFVDNKYHLTSGPYDASQTYYKSTGFEEYEVVNLYGKSGIGENYYVRNDVEPSQTLIYRKGDPSKSVNSEFKLELLQASSQENKQLFKFTIYPTGDSSTSLYIESDSLDVDYFNGRNVRVSASAYKLSDSEIELSLIVDNFVTSEVKSGSFEDFPVKKDSTGDTGLSDIILFTEVENETQSHNFYGKIYDFRLYNRGKSHQELMLLNMGTMRELYSYAPSVYKLAHSIYNDLAYMKIVDNTEENLDVKHIGGIRIFNRSVWDSIMVDNFPVSTYEMDPESPQYYENYRNPLYDSDIYKTTINSSHNVSHVLNDCVEQTLMDRLEVFNGKDLQQNTLLIYNNEEHLLTADSRITAVFSTLMPVDYDNEPMTSENVDFTMVGNTVVSKINSKTDLIKIYLSLDSSDDYFRYSTDMSPNFLISSDFNLSMWLSHGTNISLVYDKYLDDSYVTVTDNSIKNSNVNNILVPLVLPKQPNNLMTAAIGYLDMFKISDFKLSDGLIKLLRATTYYSELRIPLPCYKKGTSYTAYNTISLIGSKVPNYYTKNSDDTYTPVRYGLFESGKTYYAYDADPDTGVLTYTVATDIVVGSEASFYYTKDSSDNYVPAYGIFADNIQYYKYELTDVPSYYNKWDGIRVLKEGVYYTTCKYPMKLMPFNDDEFDSADKSNYATFYGTVRFKIDVSSSPKGLCDGEIEKYEVKGIPSKYMSENISATLSNRSELIDPDDNRTFPHRQFNIKLYAMDISNTGSNLAGYMEKNETTGDYEEQYDFEWKLVASNDFFDCYKRAWKHPDSIVKGNQYYSYDEVTGIYSPYPEDETPEYTTSCYEFYFESTGITYLDKDTLNNKCFITKEVPLFMSKNFSMPFFIAGQVKTEDDENFDIVYDATSADDDLIEPIRIRSNFSKTETSNPFSSEEEKIKASSADDLDKLVLIAGKTYKILFDYTSKVSELAYYNERYDSQVIGQKERTDYCRYYSLIDSISILNSDFEYTTDGESFSIPSSYDDNGVGYAIQNTWTEVTEPNEVTPETDIPDNIYYYVEDGKYYIAKGKFKSEVTYYKRSSDYISTEGEDLYLGNPYNKLSQGNKLLSYTTNASNILNSYKIYYMIDTAADMRNIYDMYDTVTPDRPFEIGKMYAFTSKFGDVGVVADFSEKTIIKNLYNNLLNEDIAYAVQSPSVGLISGFTKVSPNISYRKNTNVSNRIADSLTNKYVEIFNDTHELYSYSASSRTLPYQNTFDVTRTTTFKNNLLKGKQLELLNKNYWDISGDYSNASYVEDEYFGKTVTNFENVTSLELLYDGGGYVMESDFEAAINIKPSDATKINKVTVTYYNSNNEVVDIVRYDSTAGKNVLIQELELKKESLENGIDNYSEKVGYKISTSKIRFKITTSEAIDILVGKIIVRGNGSSKIANGLANCYYNNSFTDENVIVASHLVPVLKDKETNQYIPIQFKNGKITANGITRPNPGLNRASLFISRYLEVSYGNTSKISKLTTPWIRKFYYEHGGLVSDDALANSAYFHKYNMVKDSIGVPVQKEIFSNVNDIFTFTTGKDGKVDPDKCIVCNRVVDVENEETYFTLSVGSIGNDGKRYGIEMNLEEDGTLSYYGNNMIVNPQSPLGISDEKISMTYNCFNLENYRNNVSSPTVITNVQLMDNGLLNEEGSYDNREVIYEFEYLPIIYDELTHHISFNIMIKK